MNRNTSPTVIVIVALGVAADVLFRGQMLGASFPLFVVLALSALVGLAQREGVRPVRSNLWLLVPLLFFAGMVAVRANGLLTFLNVTAGLALLGLVGFFYAGGRVERLGLLGYPLAWLRVYGNALFKVAPVTGEALRPLASPGVRRGPAQAVARGVVLALPVVAVFACLLSSADLVFGRYLSDLFRLRFWRVLTGHGFTVLLFAWLLGGWLVYALQRGREEDGRGMTDRALDSLANSLSHGEPVEGEDALGRALAALGRTIPLGMVEASIVLVAVDLLFAVFVGLQLAYLFGGQANISTQGFTYAEYARRGFAELVVVAVLTLGLILGLQWLARRRSARQVRVFNALASVMMALVLVILGSAFQRLRLYEQAYGYTDTRLYVYVFMAWLGAALAWFLVTLWWRPRRFAVGACIAALGFLVTLNLINPDAFVARQNLARYQVTGKLDAEYLTTLSDDATPVLMAGLADVTGEEEWQTLRDDLQRRHERMVDDPHWQAWPAANWARWRAYYALLGTGGN